MSATIDGVTSGYPTGPLDHAFLALARHHQPTTGFFLDFEGPAPEPEALAARVLGRAADLPALNLLRPAGRARRWRPRTAGFDAAVHLHRRTGLTTPGALAAATDALLSHPLPGADQPPWDLWLLTGGNAAGAADDGGDDTARAADDDADDTARAAGGGGAGEWFRLGLRVHHAVQDGVGAAYSALALLGDEPAAGPHLYSARVPTPAGTLLAAADAVRQLRAYGAPRTWPELRTSPAGRTAWAGCDVPVARLRALADAWGTSVNDVCLAGLAQALRAWHRGGPARHCPELPVLVAMSTRGPGERYAPGNHVVGHRLVLPCGAQRLPEALARVRRQTDAVRRTRTRDARRLAVRVLPHRAGEWAMGLVKNAVPIGVSSVTVTDHMRCFGARLTGASMFYDVHDGLLGYVSFTRAGGVVRCGVVYDVALPRAAQLPHHWQRALLAADAPGATAPPTRPPATAPERPEAPARPQGPAGPQDPGGSGRPAGAHG